MYTYKQCKFKDCNMVEDGDNSWLGGIAIYDEDYGTEDEIGLFVGVICGCCGGFVEPDNIEDIQVYENWVDIEDCIRGDE